MMLNTEHPAAGKAVVYVRLSGQPYRYDPFSPDNQRRICRDHALEEQVEIVAEYQDLAVSGRKGGAERPGFEASLQLLRRRAVEILYVAKLDRFSRRGLQHVEPLLDEIDGVGGRVVFVADGLDSRNAADRRTISTLAERARAEADAATWRRSEWHAHNRRRGLWKRIRPFGYVVTNGKLHPHPAEASIVRGMVDSFLAGSSLRSIAMRLNAEGVKPPRLVFYEEAKAKGYNAKRPPATSWSYVAVRGILSAPALAALISHAGELSRDECGGPISAGIGIVTQDERAQILAELRRRALLGGARQAGQRRAVRDAQPSWRPRLRSNPGVRGRAAGTRRAKPVGPAAPIGSRESAGRWMGGPLAATPTGGADRGRTRGLGVRRRRPNRPQGARRLDRRGPSTAKGGTTGGTPRLEPTRKRIVVRRPLDNSFGLAHLDARDGPNR
jgi:DNA invertase Pin-like site-specific DNA recombinase